MRKIKQIKKIYKKPTLKVTKVKLSFFMSKMSFIDNFNFIGSVYAQSGADSGSDGSYVDVSQDSGGTSI